MARLAVGCLRPWRRAALWGALRRWLLCAILARPQDLLRQQMQLAYRIGDRDKANKIMDRLRTDEQKEKLTERMFEEGGAQPFGLP